MRLRSTTVLKILLKVNIPTEVQTAIGLDVDILRPVVCRRVDQPNVSGLQEVVSDHDVLLVGCDLEIVWADDGLVLVWVVEALRVRDVRDVEGGDVVACCVGNW